MPTERYPSPVRIAIGKELRAARERKKLTQQQAAELAGVSRQYVYSLEAGLINASVDTYEKLARVLGLTVSLDRLKAEPEK